MTKSIVSIGLLFFVCCRTVSSWTQCHDVPHSGTLTRLELSSCTEDSLPCILKKGTAPSLKLSFKPVADTSSLSISVTARIAGLDLPFPGFDTDACDPKYGITCPLSKGVEYTYSNGFKIYELYPNIRNVTSKWQLKDASNAVIVCVEIPVSIVD